MPEDESKAALTTKRLIFISVVLYGIGYLLLVLGPLFLMAEVSDVFSMFVGGPIYVTVLLFVSWFIHLVFSVSIIRSGGWVRMGDVDLSSATTPFFAYALSFVLGGVIIMVTILLGSGFPLLNFLFSLVYLVGGILLLAGFTVYQGAKELAGAVLLLASVVLLYIVGYVITYLGPTGMRYDLVGSSFSYLGVPVPGPLMSQFFVEAASLLILTIVAVVYSNPAYKGVESNRLIVSLFSVSALVFSAGLMYFNFSAAWQFVNKLISGSSGFIHMWMLTVGSIIAGISGVVVVVSAAYIIAPYARKSK